MLWLLRREPTLGLLGLELELELVALGLPEPGFVLLDGRGRFTWKLQPIACSCWFTGSTSSRGRSSAIWAAVVLIEGDPASRAESSATHCSTRVVCCIGTSPPASRMAEQPWRCQRAWRLPCWGWRW